MKDLAAELAAASLAPAERTAFLEACRPADPYELLARIPDIRSHLGVIRAAAASDPIVDVDLAERVAEVLTELAGGAARLRYEERRLVMGAIDYFVTIRDAGDDLEDLFGLDDDARVARVVCRVLDREDMADRL